MAALPAKLSRICRSRPESVSTCSGTSGPTSRHIYTPRCAACGPNISATPDSNGRSAKGSGRKARWPDSMRERSKMSLSRHSRASPACKPVSTNRRCATSRRERSSRPKAFSATFRGVRTSWLTMATKRDFSSAVRSASSLARRSPSSARLRAVMSV